MPQALAGEATAAAPATAAQAPGAVPGAKAFATLPFFANGSLSPDGQRIAGLMSLGGRQVIGIRNLFDAKDNPVSIGIPDGNEAESVQWVGNDFIIVRIHALLPFPDGDKAYITRLISVDRRTGKVQRIMWDKQGQNGGDVVWIAPDGTPEMLIAAQNSVYLDDNFYPTVYRINLETMKTRVAQIGRQGIMDWQADSAGVVRSGVGHANEGRTSMLVYRGPDQSASLREIDRVKASSHDTLFDPLVFVSGTDNALVITKGESGRQGLYEVEMTTRKTVRTVYEAPEGVEIDSALLSDDRNTVLGVVLSEGTDTVHWFDPGLAEVQKALETSVKGTGVQVRISSFSSDRKAMLVTLDRPDSPGALYYFNVDGGRMQRVAVFNAELKQTPMNPVRAIHYNARDGLVIEAILTLPKGKVVDGKPAAPLPIVMLPHGGPWAHDEVSWDYMAQYIASQGYVVMQPNFRGSTGYGEDFMRRGEGQMGLAMQDDVTDGLRWAVEQKLADPAKACIVGASYGGYAAMWGLAKDPDLYRCGISVSGVASLRREVNDFGNSLYRGKYTDDWRAMTPDFAAVSPLNAIDRIKAPLLLIHGRQDVTVAVSHSDSMASRMRGAGKVVDYISLPKADHYFTREEDREAMLTAIGAFLVKYNPAN